METLMKLLSISLGAAAVAFAATAGAQSYYYRDVPTYRASNEECWNPRAGHYEQVRPYERQDDLDFSRCRSTRIDEGRYFTRDWVPAGYECWNPRAGHFESVREGERQDDLDFGRCRRILSESYAYRRYR
jgi:hypothetical protein